MRCVLIALTMMIGILPHEATTSAAGPDFPNTLLGFIKPNMRIGIKPNMQNGIKPNTQNGIRISQGDSLVTVEIYDEEQFRFAQDARSLKREELERKYPTVSEKAAKALADYESSIEAEASRTDRGFGFGNNVAPSSVEPFVELEVDRTITLCTVLHVGEDYFLVTFGEDNSRKLVIAKQAVTRISWASDELRFNASLRPIRRSE